MPNSTAPVCVRVASLGGLGDGIAEYDGKPLFIPKSVPGDRLEVRIAQETRDAWRGDILSVQKSGPDRASPPCPHFSDCGGCNLQQLKPDAYRRFKERMVEEAFRHAGFADTPGEVVFLPAASRRRAEFKWDAEHASLAYYAARSRDLVPVSDCLILEPALAALMTPLAKALATLPDHHNIRTVNLTAADSGIDMVLGLVAKRHFDKTALERLAEKCGLARIGMTCPDKSFSTAVKRLPVTMQLGGYPVRLPPGAFLQASCEGQRLLTEAVLEGVAGVGRVADLFCGIGTYSFPLSHAAQVHAVEQDAAMIGSLRKSVKENGLATTFSVEARDLFRTPLTEGELNRFDAVVINPPRIGARAQSQKLARAAVRRAVMVSCNPATFARDAKILKEAGFTLTAARAIDQFVYSPHVEIVAAFSR